MDYFKQFKIYISNNNYPAFLSLWEEYCGSDEIDPEELKQILLLIKPTTMAEPFGRYVEHILPLWETIKDDESSHEIFSLIFDLQNTNVAELANLAITYLKERSKDDEMFMQKLRLTGLRDGINFQGAISRFDLLTHMEKGNFVFHTRGWGVGEIMEVSLLREQLTLELENISGRKDFSFKNAFNTLIPIPNDHFLAMRFGDPDKLETWAKKDPVAVVQCLLRDLGPKSAGEIKDELLELVIPQADWARWWQTTRNKLKKCTLIEMPDDLHSPFILRDAEVSHAEMVEKILEESKTLDQLIQGIYTFLRDFPTALRDKEFKAHLVEKLKEILSREELTDVQELQIHFFLSDLLDKYTPAKDLVTRLKNIRKIVLSIAIIAFKKRALTLVRQLRDDWAEIFLDLLFEIDQATLRDYILIELIKKKEIAPLLERLENLSKNPHEHPLALVWYFQKIMANPSLPMGDQQGRSRFFEAFLTLFYILESQKTHRELIKKMYNFLTLDRFANVRAIFKGETKESLSEFLLLATKCHTITDHDKKILHSLAEVVHPSLGKLNTAYREDTSEEADIIWTTEEGFNKLKETIHKIATVDTVENAKQIEIARSYGDLRENAEYKSAQEERRNLQNKLRRHSKELSSARILTKEDVDGSVVGVGTIVHLKGDKGEITYTILGPWDANPDDNILSFQSKLAQELKGKKVGEKVSISGGVMTIEAIDNYFDKKGQ